MSAKKKTLGLYVGIISIILFVSLIVFHEFIIYGHEFLFDGVLSDLLRVNYPVYCDLYDNIANGWSFWSWNMGIGTNVLTHADVMFDPFTYVMFLFGKGHIADMMVWSLIMKIICEGISISFLLRYFKFDNRAVLFASVAYAFSGYSLIMGSNLALGTILVYFPLIILGIEKFVSEKKAAILIASLFFTCILSYYYFFVSGILIVAYLIVKSIYQKKQLNTILIQLALLALMAVIVIGMAGFILLPQLDIVRNSARTAVSDVTGVRELLFPKFGVLITAILRLFGNDILGNMVVDDYLGSPKDYFQLTTYTSALCLLLVFQVWKYLSERQKKLLQWSISLLVIAVLFPICSFALNAFSTVNYRWMFFVNLLLTVGVAFCLDLLLKQGEINKKALLKGTCATYAVIFVGMFIYAGLTYGDNYFETLNRVVLAGRKSVLTFTCEVIFLFSFCYFLSVYREKSRLRKNAGTVFMVGLLVFEIVANYFTWFNVEGEIWNYTGEQGEAYEDESASVIRSIQAEDVGFYRINKNFDSVYDKNQIPSENDAIIQQYYGLKSYNSVNNGQYITFLQNMGIYVCNPLSLDSYMEKEILPEGVTGQDLNYIDGVGSDYDLMSYLGVKYYLSNEEDEVVPDSFRLLEQYSSEDIKVYENELYLPLAFVNGDEISYDSFMQLSEDEKRTALMLNTVVDSTEKETVLDGNAVEESIREKQEAFQLISFSEDEIELKIKGVDSEAYISFLMPYDKDWNVYIDGVKTRTEKVNISLLGAKMEAGTHTVKLVYRPSIVYLGLKIAAVASILLVVVVVIFKVKRYSLAELCMLLEEKTKGVRFLSVHKKTYRQMKITGVFLGNVFVLTLFAIYMKENRTSVKVSEESEIVSDWSKYTLTDIREDALEIDTEDSLAEINEPRRVICTQTKNLPEDCELGVEYVYFYDSHNVTIQILGRDNSNRPRMWIRQYTEAEGWSEYYSMSYGQ